MDRKSYVGFLARCFYQQIEYQLHQADPTVNITVDFDAFLRSFSYIPHADAEPVAVQPRESESLTQRPEIHDTCQTLLQSRKDLVGTLHGLRKPRSSRRNPPSNASGPSEGSGREPDSSLQGESQAKTGKRKRQARAYSFISGPSSRTHA
jgi:hypothetical protein